MITNKDSGSLLELTLLEESLGELHQVGVEDFGSLFLGEAEAFFPLTTLGEHFETTHITTLNDLVEFASLNEHGLLLLLDLVDQHLLHLSGSHLLGTLEGSIPLLALHVSVNGLLEISLSFVDFSCGVKLIDLQHSLSKNNDHILNSILGKVHGKVEAIVPDFLQKVGGKHGFSDFKVSVNSLVVVARLFPHFGRVKNFIW